MRVFIPYIRYWVLILQETKVKDRAVMLRALIVPK
jgi:hypothetical protein